MNNERLLAANKQDLNVVGIVKLKGAYHGKSIYMNCLVTDDLKNEIIVSWHDAHWVGAIIRPDYGDGALPHYNAPAPGCNAISSLQEKPPPRKKVPPLADSKKEEILKGWYEKFPCLSDEMSDKPMKGEPMIINLV